MKIRATRLFAVMLLGGGAAHADVTQVSIAPQPPAPKVQPLKLATGAPACGNVSYKAPEDPICKVIRINRESEEKAEQIQRDQRERRAKAIRALTGKLIGRPRP
jgi:hypothetical protein